MLLKLFLSSPSRLWTLPPACAFTPKKRSWPELLDNIILASSAYHELRCLFLKWLATCEKVSEWFHWNQWLPSIQMFLWFRTSAKANIMNGTRPPCRWSEVPKELLYPGSSDTSVLTALSLSFPFCLLSRCFWFAVGGFLINLICSLVFPGARRCQHANLFISGVFVGCCWDTFFSSSLYPNSFGGF